MFWNQVRWTIWFIMSSWALKFSDDDYLDTLCFGVFHIKKYIYIFAFLVYLHLSVQFSRSFMYESLWPHGLQHARLLCPSPTPGACSDSCPLSRWCHPTISSSVVPSPPTFNRSQHQGLFQWVVSFYQVAKLLALQLHHQSCQWIFRTDFL